MIPKIIHFTVPKKLSPQQQASIETAKRLHPGWEVKVWQDPIDPTGFRLAKFWDKANSGAQLADMVRLEVVHREGGFYLDSDFVALKPLEALRAYPFVVGTEDGEVLTNAFFGAEAGSPVLEGLIGDLLAREVNWSLPPDETTGPKFFANRLKWRDGVTVLPREALYPHNWDERRKEPHPWTYGVHEWANSWRPRISIKGLYRRAVIATHDAGRACLDAVRRFTLAWNRVNRNARAAPYSAEGVLCAQTIHGYKIYLRGDDGSVTPEIAQHGTYELQEEKWLRKAVRPGDWVVDVGANVGMLSLLCAQRVGPFGRVFSYEPNPLCSSLLKRSLVMNWMHERVKVRDAGVGDAPGRLNLRYSPDCLGGATLVGQEDTGTMQSNLSVLQNEATVEVEVVRLDDEFPVDVPIRLVKVDVEGFEYAVLRGARRLFDNRCVDLLMLEFSPEITGAGWVEYLAEIERLVQVGYTPCRLAGGRLRPVALSAAVNGGVGRNLFLASPRGLASL